MDCLFRSMVSTLRADRVLPCLLVLAAASVVACSSDPAKKKSTGVTAAPEGEPWPTLAEWHLFTDAVKQAPAERVVPYDVNAQLFADYAAKYRFLYVPEGAHIEYASDGVWNLPVGTIFVKTFSYLTDARDPSKGERILETRLLLHESGGWEPLTYVWNAEQTEAKLVTIGTTIPSHFIDLHGTERDNAYVVPTRGDCRQCHGKLGSTDTLGGKTLQMDRMHDYGSGPENQIDHLRDLGFFASDPEPASARQHLIDPMDTAQPLNERVRSYFDGNCAHCHRPGEYAASSSGMYLDYASTDPSQPTTNWGLCKKPTSSGGGTCGRALDVIPGLPDESILMCRMEATQGIGRMPPLGRNFVDEDGLALVREWITALPGSCSATTLPDAGTSDSGAQPEAGTAQDAAGGG